MRRDDRNSFTAQMHAEIREALGRVVPEGARVLVLTGAGANVALACDLVIAARSLGLTLLGEKLSAEQAAAWGLIWRCVEDAELASTVDSLARQLGASDDYREGVGAFLEKRTPRFTGR